MIEKFIDDVKNKFGNFNKSYSAKSVLFFTKNSKNSESNEKRSKNQSKKGGY